MVAHSTFDRGGEGSSPSGPIEQFRVSEIRGYGSQHIEAKVLAAAFSALNRWGEGSSPSGLTEFQQTIEIKVLVAARSVSIRWGEGSSPSDLTANVAPMM